MLIIKRMSIEEDQACYKWPNLSMRNALRQNYWPTL